MEVEAKEALRTPIHCHRPLFTPLPLLSSIAFAAISVLLGRRSCASLQRSEDSFEFGELCF